SCSLTSYTQRARGQQLPCPGTAVDPVHLPTTTLSEPEVSNCLVPEPPLILFTYPLQHSASQRSAMVSSCKRRRSGTHKLYHPIRTLANRCPRYHKTYVEDHLPSITPANQQIRTSHSPESH